MAADTRLRILLVPSAYYPHSGGIEETTRRLALELERRGHRAAVVTNRWPAGTAPRETVGGVRVRRLEFELPARRPAGLLRFGRAAPAAAAALLRLCSVFQPHVVHVHGAGPNAAYVAALRRPIGAPIVFSAHGEFRNDAHAVFERSRPLRWALQTLLRQSAAITAPSRVVLDELREQLDVVSPAMVLPNAVDPEEFARRPSVHGSPYLFAAGRMVEQKGIDLVLHAYARARARLGGRRLVVAGDGPERSALGRQASELGIDANVSFTGVVGRDRLAELMCGADAFVFPSRQEAFGIALLEAMAAGTPAVATRVGGIPEFARDGENALLVAPDDPEQLAVALVRLVEDDELRGRLVAGGRAQAAHHSWDRLGVRYEELYRAVAHD